jgi:type III secretion protein S
MELETLTTYVKQALVLVLWLSLPVVLVTAVLGVAVAFLQAITQVQDQTVSFALKLLAAILTIAVTSAWLGGELFNFADRMFATVPNIR